MKNISTKLFLLLIILLSFVCINCSKNRSWELISNINISHDALISGFHNENYGITLFVDIYYYTKDGGKTWSLSKVKDNMYGRYGIEILDNKITWHCGNFGYNGVTHDGGKTWDKITSYGLQEGNHCRYLSFVDKNFGWIASPDKLAYTNNCGEEWNEIKLPHEIFKIISISLISNEIGFLLDNKGYLFFTKDNGKYWQFIKIKNFKFPKYILAIPTTAMRFIDEKNGIIISHQTKPDKKWIVLSTNDGGRKWIKEKLSIDFNVNSYVYISRDSKTVTIKDKNEIKVLRRNKIF